MRNQDPAAQSSAAPRSAKALPNIIEATERPATRDRKVSSPFSPLVCRLIAVWRHHKNADRLATAGDGALCAIGLSMLAAAFLAYFGVI